jgi:hypothetical protein
VNHPQDARTKSDRDSVNRTNEIMNRFFKLKTVMRITRFHIEGSVLSKKAIIFKISRLYFRVRSLEIKSAIIFS